MRILGRIDITAAGCDWTGESRRPGGFFLGNLEF